MVLSGTLSGFEWFRVVLSGFGWFRVVYEWIPLKTTQNRGLKQHVSSGCEWF